MLLAIISSYFVGEESHLLVQHEGGIANQFRFQALVLSPLIPGQTSGSHGRFYVSPVPAKKSDFTDIPSDNQSRFDFHSFSLPSRHIQVVVDT